jgi:hypothetical protein
MKTMRNIFKFLFASLFVVTFSCVDSENTIDAVLDYETGAILRTISVNNAVLNSSDPTSTFSVTVEEQDEADGTLFSHVNVYSQMKDLSPGNGDSSTDFMLVKEVPASSFSTGPVGLPRGTIEVAFGDATAAMGLTANGTDYIPGDVFVIGLEVVLTDGRSYDWTTAAGIITGGFFSSPFKYNALLTCSPMAGDYVIDMIDTYGDGWQGMGISVDVDGVITTASLCNMWGASPPNCIADPNAVPGAVAHTGTMTVTVPPLSEAATWTYDGDSYPSEVEFYVYDPDGNLIYTCIGCSGGLLPIAVCAL